MSDRLGRLAPLTGVLFAVVTIVAIFTGGNTPEANATVVKVFAYYRVHHSEVEASDILFVVAFLILVFFAGSLRSYMRRSEAAEGASALVLAGGAMMALGAAVGTSVEYALAHHISELSPTTVQVLNVLSNELFLPLLVGAFVFSLGSGVAILRGAALPKWLGWVAIAMAIAVLIPPASFPALIVFVIWSIVVSILVYRRSDSSAQGQGQAVTATV